MSDETTRWNGADWSVRRTPDAPAPITVQVEQALNADAARELAVALHHAAWCADGQLTQEDYTHAMLIGVLMRAGGSIDLPVEMLENDVFGSAAGRHYGYELTTTATGLRLSVTPAPEQG
ncbi:hypothetical protein [Amycolatopsis sacchari]|uniref:hypothetical protein n=1 Tax=Amycolatopsis sacchari TaxID=115433 RepID=UPI003D706A9C